MSTKTVHKTVTEQTKKPTGLSIKRNGNAFKVTWKIGDANYSDGQQFYWQTNLSNGWNKVSCGNSTTAKTVSLDWTKYFPSTKNALTYFKVRIRGNRQEYTTEKTKKEKDGDKIITKTKHVMQWSDYATEEFAINNPDEPTASATLSDTYDNVCSFSWSAPHPAENHRPVRGVKWQTVLLKNSDVTDGEKAFDVKPQVAHSEGTSTATSGTQTITEDTSYINGTNSYTRWFRVEARGPKGTSHWVYKKHVYAKPIKTDFVKANYKFENSAQVTVSWEAFWRASRPIDSMVVQYAVGVPDAGMAAPASLSPTDAATVKYKDGSNAAKFAFDRTTMSDDEVLFVRVNTWHDRNEVYGSWKIVNNAVEPLAAPTLGTITPVDATHKATVTVSDFGTTVSDAFLAVLYKDTKNPGKELIVGVIDNGQTSVNVQCPNWDGYDKSFGVRAYVGNYTAKTRADGVKIYTISAYDGKPLMTSEKVWDNGQVPKAPSGVTVSKTNTPGTVKVTWNNTWQNADAAELTWADHEDAWESTDQPNSYTISSIYAASWNISGLEVGKEWYIRLRLLSGADENVTPGPWSDIKTISLSETPATPGLVLSQPAIPPDGIVTASWNYISTDGTPQSYAEITEATIDANGIHYGVFTLTSDATVVADKKYYEYVSNAYTEVTPVGTENPSVEGWYEFNEAKIARVTTPQHIDLNAATLGWVTNNTYNLCVRVASAGGEVSAWSAPVPVAVVAPLSINITSTSLQNVTVSDDDDDGLTSTVLSLTDMPLSVTVTGAGDTGTTTVAIERAASYYLDRPDERTFTGHEGETVALYSQTGEDTITFDNVSLIGTLDDGAQYKIVATIQDGFGQSAEETLDFEVHWAHQATEPTADILIDNDNLIAIITPIAPDSAYELTSDDTVIADKKYYELVGTEYVEVTPIGTEDPSNEGWYEVTDVADIYRLSVDRPELVFKGAEFGTMYVDPYPALGEMGGYRIVLRTKNGDYITPQNTIAWADYTATDGYGVDTMYNIIDFDGGQVRVMYDITVNAGWEKDFQQTKYLGGHIQGDWNNAVSRTGSVGGSLITTENQETIQQLRRLADYPGICHVRTRDGSSYAADVQVSESRDMGRDILRSEFTLSITRVDPEGFDGLTYEDWLSNNES